MKLIKIVMAFCKACMRNKSHSKCYEPLDGKTYLVCEVCHTATEAEE